MEKDDILWLIKQIYQKVKNDECEMSRERQYEILKDFIHEPMSKVQAYRYLNLRRDQFDYKLRTHQLPPGRKREGFNEQVWYRDELDEYKNHK